MNRQSLNHIARFALGGTFALALAVVGGCSNGQQQSEQQQQHSQQQQSEQEFGSPEKAAQAFIDALRAGDKPALARIFGENSEDLLASGDEVADQAKREKFLTAYDQKHGLDRNGDSAVTVIVGDQDWPLPIPIVKDDANGQWFFDTEAGKDEVINRRIGRNELDVIQVCEAIVDAQADYVQRNPDQDNLRQYARKFISDPGKHNGLFWESASGEEPSPLGPLVADAVEEGYTTTPSDQPRPYHGYYYRMLTAQGPNAPGGALDYVANGQMIGGFAAVAYPADYGNSGIMTFMVNYRGDLYQKDLGPDTAKSAKAITSFDPDPSWQALPTQTPPATQPSVAQN